MPVDPRRLTLLVSDLPHRVAVQRKTESVDSYGKKTKTWTTLGTYWASVEPLRGRERERARAIRSDLTHTVYLRHRIDVTPQDRLLFQGRILNVTSAINVGERNIALELLCAEVAGGA